MFAARKFCAFALLVTACGAQDHSTEAGSPEATAADVSATAGQNTQHGDSASNSAASNGNASGDPASSGSVDGPTTSDRDGNSSPETVDPGPADTSSAESTAVSSSEPVASTPDGVAPGNSSDGDPGSQEPSTSSPATSDGTAGGTEMTDETTAGASSDVPPAGQPPPSTPATAYPVELELSPVPIPRGEHGVGALNGEVYVLGGFTPTVTSSVQVYNPEQDSWRDAADFPVVFHHPNVASVGGLLYVLGFHAGSGQRMADGRAFAYDPTADAWTPRASQPLGTERGASCVTTFEDKIYLFGGTNDVALADASLYDPAQDSWEQLPLLPALRHHCIAAVVNGKIYIVSGRDVIIEEVQTESYVFDPVSRKYEQVAPILTPRGGAAGGVLGGLIYVFGGEGNTNDPRGIFHEAEVYDPGTDQWSSLPDMTVPRHGLGAAVIGDRMYLPGGSTSQGIDVQTTNSVFFLQAP